MDHISTLIPKVLKKRGLNKVAKSTNLVQQAQSWINDHLPKHSADLCAKALIDTTLTITAKNSIAAQEAHHKTSALLHFLSEVENNLPVDQIRIVRDL